MWTIRVVTMATMALVMVAVQAASQTDCGDFGNEGCGANEHYIWGGGENNKNPHSHCYGPCAPGVSCHPVCTVELASDPVLLLNYLALLAAVNEKDVSRVVELAVGKPGFVAFNRERMSLQVRGCSGGTIVANIPVHGAALVEIASRLPSPTQVLAALAPKSGPRDEE